MTNRSFGSVRRPNTNVKDISGRLQGLPADYVAGGYGSYAAASGVTQTNLAQARADLKVLQEERVVLQAAVTKAKQALDANYTALKRAGEGWRACGSTDCKSHHSKSRCDGCREPWDTKIKAAEDARPALATALTAAQQNLSAKDAEIKQVEETIATLIAAVEAENLAEQTLAEQGTSSEAIAEEAKAKAAAEVETARVAAETAASGKKTRNMILLLVGAAVVIVGVMFVVKKMRKKK